MKRFEFRPRWLCRVANAIFVGKIHKEMDHPVSRMLMNLYRPVVTTVLRHQWTTIIAAVLVMALTVPIFFRLGSVHAAS